MCLLRITFLFSVMSIHILCLFSSWSYLFSLLYLCISLNIKGVSTPLVNQDLYIQQNCPSKVKEKSRHSQINKSWGSSVTIWGAILWAMSMSNSGMRRMQLREWLNSVTIGSTARLCMPSCLLSLTSGSHAVGRWGNVPMVASATSCTATHLLEPLAAAPRVGTQAQVPQDQPSKTSLTLRSLYPELNLILCPNNNVSNILYPKTSPELHPKTST